MRRRPSRLRKFLTRVRRLSVERCAESLRLRLSTDSEFRGDGDYVATLMIPFAARYGRPRKKIDVKRILTLRAQGLSWRKIAKRLHVGTGTAFRAAQGRSKNVP